jgi:hypothetical protein
MVQYFNIFETYLATRILPLYTINQSRNLPGWRWETNGIINVRGHVDRERSSSKLE